MSRRHTIGLLAGYQVYWGTTVGWHMRTLLSGISAAARDRDCHLLLACGISSAIDTPNPTSAWPLIGPDCDTPPDGRLAAHAADSGYGRRLQLCWPATIPLAWARSKARSAKTSSAD